MSSWERLLLSSVPDTTSWPPKIKQKSAPIPLASPTRRLRKKSRALAPATTLSPPASTAVARATKRRPSVLGGGFSTAGLPSMSSVVSTNSCPWGDHDTAHGARGLSPPHGSIGGAGRAERRGSRPESLLGNDVINDHGDNHDEQGVSTATDMSVVGWGDRCRRRSSLRASREGAVEANNDGGWTRWSITSADNSQQEKNAEPETRRTSAASRASNAMGGKENDSHASSLSLVHQRADSCLSTEERREHRARLSSSAYVDIVSRETTGSEDAASTSVSTSVGHTAADITTVCPAIAPISPHGDSPRRDSSSAILSPASGSSDFESTGSAVPTISPGRSVSAPWSPPDAPTSRLPLLPGGGGGGVVALDTVTDMTTRLMNGAASAPSLSTLGSLKPNARGVSAPNFPKVFHNFVFRRSKLRGDRKPTSSLRREHSSSSRNNSTTGAGLAGGSSVLTSRDDGNNNGMNNTNSAGHHLSVLSPAAGGVSSRVVSISARGRYGSVGGSTDATSCPWRRRNLESLHSVSSDRPDRPWKTKRTCPPPRTANDAFSVRSLGPSSPSSDAPSLNLHHADAVITGVGRGGRRFGGMGRPLKCQRCGSGRVHLFATTAAEGNGHHPSLARASRKHVGHNEGSSPPRGHRRPQNASTDGGGCSGGSGVGGGGGAGHLSSTPMMNNHPNHHTRTSQVYASENNKLSGWSDSGRTTPAAAPTARATTPPRFGCSGGRNAANRSGGRAEGTPAVRSGRRPSMRPPRIGDSALAPARAPLQLPSAS